MADIAFESLSRWYGETPRRRVVLDGVSGHIRAGEFVVVSALDSHDGNEVRIDPDHWTTLRTAINEAVDQIRIYEDRRD